MRPRMPISAKSLPDTPSSSIVRTPPPATGVYAATNYTQVLFSSILAKELAGRNISVNSIGPGAVDTQLLRQHGEEPLRGIPSRRRSVA
jgi:3-oxoacyl-[acyl-carrier protein] reductase